MRREEYRDLLLAESEESGKVTRERPPYADALLKRCEEGDPKYTLNECFRDVSKEVLLDLLDTMGSSGNESLNQEILLAKLIHAVVDLERMQTRLPMLRSEGTRLNSSHRCTLVCRLLLGSGTV